MDYLTEDKFGAQWAGQWVRLATTWHYRADAPRPNLAYLHQEVHHDFVPLWVRKTYQAPGGQVETFGRHVLGLWLPALIDPSLKGQYVSDKIQDPLPPDWPAKFGDFVYEVRTLEGPALADGRPGDFEPYDGGLIQWLKAVVKAAREKTERQRQDAWENAQEAKRLKSIDQIRANQEDKIQDQRPWIQRAARGEDPRHIHQPLKIMEGTELSKEESVADVPPPSAPECQGLEEGA